MSLNTKGNIMEEKTYYLDNANTTFLGADVYKKILECYTKCQCDEHSIYSLGRNSSEELELARKKVAKAIGAKPDEIIFTSGLEESNNWAIKGLAKANSSKGKHIITSVIEDKNYTFNRVEPDEQNRKIEARGRYRQTRLNNLKWFSSLQSKEY